MGRGRGNRGCGQGGEETSLLQGQPEMAEGDSHIQRLEVGPLSEGIQERVSAEKEVKALSV